MLDHILDKIAEVREINKIAVISNSKFYGQFLEWKKNRNNGVPAAGLTVLDDGTASDETRRGAIGDIKFAIDELQLDEDAIVIAGDNFFTFRLIDLYNFYKARDADSVVVKKISDKGVLRTVGVAAVAPDGTVLDFEEKPENPKSDYAVYATYIYKRETLPMFGAYLEEGNPKDAPGNFPAWLCKRKKVVAYAFDGDCYDVGTPEAYGRLCGDYRSA